jgi:hypothetical protein
VLRFNPSIRQDTVLQRFFVDDFHRQPGTAKTCQNSLNRTAKQNCEKMWQVKGSALPMAIVEAAPISGKGTAGGATNKPTVADQMFCSG